jgi:hypothetical protein
VPEHLPPARRRWRPLGLSGASSPEGLISVTILEPNAALSGTAPADAGMATGTLPSQRAGVSDYGNVVAPSADPSSGAMPGTPDVQTDAGLSDLETYLADQAAAAEAELPITPIPIPLPPIPIRTRAVSGRYRSPAVGFQLELRVDIDGRRPLHKLSGDYFSVSGGTTTFFGSWTVDAVTTSVVNGATVTVGTARTTWPTTFTVAKVTVPRRTIFQPAAPATIQWSTPSGALGGTYLCGHESAAMRTVELEQDVESGVAAFDTYNTGSLPSGGTVRQLTVAAAYAEAGIQALDTGGGNVINTPADHVWNNASLHGAMMTHFSRFQERPQFKVWLLHAQRHEIGPNLRGIMFDSQGLQRQGCASFYQVIQSPTPANLREQLYVNVHELGHCFNLFHSFHKAFMTPPLPNRPGSLSWMNYPQNYNPGNGAPSGAAAFWAAFGFQFDDLELAHVRHGFRDNVIMGGAPFGTGGALEGVVPPTEPIEDASGLRLSIRTSPERPVIGTPIVLEMRLTAERGQFVHTAEMLHPKYELVQITISRPRGDVIVHRPPVLHCAEPELMRVDAGTVLPVSAYIGYDATVGQIFEDPGTYRIRAAYAAPNGSIVVSDGALVRVWGTRDTEDDAVAEVLLREDVGMAMTLLGSDSLPEAMSALEEVATDHSNHPAAVYARLALGINAARPFTAVEPDGSVRVRGRDLDRADQLLAPAIDASRGDEGLDDLTVFQVMTYLASSHADEGDHDKARELRQEIGRLADEKGVPPTVLEQLNRMKPFD